MSRPPSNPYPYGSAYAFPHSSQSRQAQTGQAKVNADLAELQRLFPGVERVVIESVYGNVGNNMDQTCQALMEMSAPVRQTPQQDSNSISPQTKLNFLKVVFDKLNPSFLQQTLEKYRWSVEAALDDLLTAEDQRSKLEEEQRKKEELLRRQREEEERQRLRQAELDLTHKSSSLLLQQMFPKMPQQLIGDTLRKNNWDQRLAVETLLPLERMRFDQEERENRIREEHLRKQEERRRHEEEQRILSEADRLGGDALEAMVREVTSWDELAMRLAGPPPQSVKDAEKERERGAMVEAARAFALTLTEPEIRMIFEEVGWDQGKGLAKIDERSVAKFRSKLQQTFPTLPNEAIDQGTRFYPDESAAMAHLRPMAEKQDKISLLSDALSAARARLDDVHARYGDYNKYVEEVKANWSRRSGELSKLTGAERMLMQTAQEMLQQKESAQIVERQKTLTEELELRTKEFLELQDQLNKSLSESVTLTHPSVSLPSAPLHIMNHEDRIRVAERKMRDHERAKHEELEAKKSIVADKVRKEFGEARFAQLQEAIGRAPGGVAKGFYREDFNTRTERDKTEASLASLTPSKIPSSSPAQKPVIPTGATTHVSDIANKLSDLHLAPKAAQPSTPPPPSPSPSQYPPGYPLSPPPAPMPSLSPIPPSPLLPTMKPQPQPSSPHPSSPLPVPSPPPVSSPPLGPSSSQLAYSAMAHTQPALFGLPTPPAHNTFYFASPAEEQYYSHLFVMADASRSGIQIDMKDAQFFRRSGIPDADLAHVWAIASKGANRLLKSDFFVALRLIALAQSKRPLDLNLIATPGLPLPVFHGIPLPSHTVLSSPLNPSSSSSSQYAPLSTTMMGMAAPTIGMGIPVAPPPSYYHPNPNPNPNLGSSMVGFSPVHQNPNMGYYSGYPPSAPM